MNCLVYPQGIEMALLKRLHLNWLLILKLFINNFYFKLLFRTQHTKSLCIICCQLKVNMQWDIYHTHSQTEIVTKKKQSRVMSLCVCYNTKTRSDTFNALSLINIYGPYDILYIILPIKTIFARTKEIILLDYNLLYLSYYRSLDHKFIMVDIL